MNNPKYAITITHFPLHKIGSEFVNNGSGTYSVGKYTGNYFVASMHEANISATGSTYTDALDNLLILSNDVDYLGIPPLNNTRNW